MRWRRGKFKLPEQIIAASAASIWPSFRTIPRPQTTLLQHRQLHVLQHGQPRSSVIDLECPASPRRTAGLSTSDVDVLAFKWMSAAGHLTWPVRRIDEVVFPAPFGPIKACRAPFSRRN